MASHRPWYGFCRWPLPTCARYACLCPSGTSLWSFRAQPACERQAVDVRLDVGGGQACRRVDAPKRSQQTRSTLAVACPPSRGRAPPRRQGCAHCWLEGVDSPPPFHPNPKLEPSGTISQSGAVLPEGGRDSALLFESCLSALHGSRRHRRCPASWHSAYRLRGAVAESCKQMCRVMFCVESSRARGPERRRPLPMSVVLIDGPRAHLASMFVCPNLDEAEDFYGSPTPSRREMMFWRSRYFVYVGLRAIVTRGFAVDPVTGV